MSQTRVLSVTAAIANVIVGYLLAVLAQLAVFPVFGLTVTLPQSLGIGAVLTGLSLARSYGLRRVFDRLGG